MKRNKGMAVSALAGASLLALAGVAMPLSPALAQDTGPAASDPAATAAASDDGDIVVTAQRQSQSLEKVPLSITAVSAETMANLNIRNVDAIATVATGVVLDTAFSFPTFFIRGIGAQNSPGVGLETPVAIYIDGAYNPRNTGTPFDLYDTSSVELLKGPQGTLYGRNASGGAILMKTADPTDEFGARLMLEAGKFGHRQVDAMVNVPAGETLSFRFAGRYRDDDGFVFNEFNDRRVRGRESIDFRAKMKWEPTPDFRMVAAFDYHDEDGYALAAAVNDSLATRTSGLPFNHVNSDFTITEPARAYNANWNIQYQSGDFTITNIVNYRDVKARLSDDNDHTPLPLVAINAGWGGKTFSEDLQIASSFGGMFDFMVGALYAHDKAFSDMNLYGTFFGIPYTGDTIPAGAIMSDQFVTSESYGAFAEAYIRPTDALTFTVGGRYGKDKRKLRGPAPNYTNRFSDSQFTPRLVAAYQLDTVNLYASYTEGYLAGGFNIPTFGPQDPLESEKVKSIEIGAKFLSDDRRTRINIAAFRYNYTDVQVTTCCDAQGQAQRANAASARGKGIELDVSHKPAPWLTLAVGGAYLDAYYRNFTNASVFIPDSVTAPTGTTLGLADISGSTMPRAPKWTGYANIGIEGPVAGDWEGRLNIVGRYSSKFFYSPAGGGPLQADVQKSHAIVNMSGGIGPSSKDYEIGFYIDNLTDKKYYANRATGPGSLVSRIAPPRSYGVRLTLQM